MIKKSLSEESIPIIEYIYEESKVFPNSKEDLEKPKNWNLIQSDNFDINIKTFDNILNNLDTKNLIKITDKIQASPPDTEASLLAISYVTLNLNELKKYLSKLKSTYPKRTEPIIDKETLEVMAREIGEITSTRTLINFLENCGVDKKLIIYPNTKWKMIYDVLEYFSYSAKNEDRNTLFRIIEKAAHPSVHNNKKIAKSYKKKFNTLLKNFRLREKKDISLIKKADSNIIKVKTKSGLLIFNKNTGYVKLNNFEAKENINPKSQEAKTLLKLMTSMDHQTTYQDLLDKDISKTKKRNLSFIIRNLKQTLGILPKKKAKNKDCIKNIKLYGYKLIT
jgi:hypothetical protein